MSDAGDGVTTDAGPERFRCPGCDEDVDVATESVGRLVRCPYCRTDFFADHDRRLATIVDDTPAAAEIDAAAALHSNRASQILALRRGAIKARSAWVIAAFLAGTTALDFAAKVGLYLAVTGRWGPRPAAFSVAAAAAVAFAVYALRRAAAFGRELATTTLPEPTQPPDFEPLGNGADRWRMLDDVR